MCFPSHFAARTQVFLLKSVARKWLQLIYDTRLEFGYVDQSSDHRPSNCNVCCIEHQDWELEFPQARPGLASMHQHGCYTVWQALTSAMSINWLHWMFPGKSGMKSACNVGSRRCRHDRRVLVIPLLSLMGMFSLAEVIAAMNTVFVCGSVCGRRQDDRQETTRAHLQCTIFSTWQTTAGSCETMHQHGDDRRTRWTSRLQPPGRPSHLPHSQPPASGARQLFEGDSGRVDVQKQNIYEFNFAEENKKIIFLFSVKIGVRISWQADWHFNEQISCRIF